MYRTKSELVIGVCLRSGRGDVVTSITISQSCMAASEDSSELLGRSVAGLMGGTLFYSYVRCRKNDGFIPGTSGGSEVLGCSRLQQVY